MGTVVDCEAVCFAFNHGSLSEANRQMSQPGVKALLKRVVRDISSGERLESAIKSDESIRCLEPFLKQEDKSLFVIDLKTHLSSAERSLCDDEDASTSSEYPSLMRLAKEDPTAAIEALIRSIFSDATNLVLALAGAACIKSSESVSSFIGELSDMTNEAVASISYIATMKENERLRLQLLEALGVLLFALPASPLQIYEPLISLCIGFEKKNLEIVRSMYTACSLVLARSAGGGGFWDDLKDKLVSGQLPPCFAFPLALAGVEISRSLSQGLLWMQGARVLERPEAASVLWNGLLSLTFESGWEFKFPGLMEILPILAESLCGFHEETKESLRASFWSGSFLNTLNPYISKFPFQFPGLLQLLYSLGPHPRLDWWLAQTVIRSVCLRKNAIPEGYISGNLLTRPLFLWDLILGALSFPEFRCERENNQPIIVTGIQLHLSQEWVVFPVNLEISSLISGLQRLVGLGLRTGLVKLGAEGEKVACGLLKISTLGNSDAFSINEQEAVFKGFVTYGEPLAKFGIDYFEKKSDACDFNRMMQSSISDLPMSSSVLSALIRSLETKSLCDPLFPLQTSLGILQRCAGTRDLEICSFAFRLSESLLVKVRAFVLSEKIQKKLSDSKISEERHIWVRSLSEEISRLISEAGLLDLSLTLLKRSKNAEGAVLNDALGRLAPSRREETWKLQASAVKFLREFLKFSGIIPDKDLFESIAAFCTDNLPGASETFAEIVKLTPMTLTEINVLKKMFKNSKSVGPAVKAYLNKSEISSDFASKIAEFEEYDDFLSVYLKNGSLKNFEKIPCRVSEAYVSMLTDECEQLSSKEEEDLWIKRVTEFLSKFNSIGLQHFIWNESEILQYLILFKNKFQGVPLVRIIDELSNCLKSGEISEDELVECFSCWGLEKPDTLIVKNLQKSKIFQALLRLVQSLRSRGIADMKIQNILKEISGDAHVENITRYGQLFPIEAASFFNLLVECRVFSENRQVLQDAGNHSTSTVSNFQVSSDTFLFIEDELVLQSMSVWLLGHTKSQGIITSQEKVKPELIVKCPAAIGLLLNAVIDVNSVSLNFIDSIAETFQNIGSQFVKANPPESLVNSLSTFFELLSTSSVNMCGNLLMSPLVRLAAKSDFYENPCLGRLWLNALRLAENVRGADFHEIFKMRMEFSLRAAGSRGTLAGLEEAFRVAKFNNAMSINWDIGSIVSVLGCEESLEIPTFSPISKIERVAARCSGESIGDELYASGGKVPSVFSQSAQWIAVSICELYLLGGSRRNFQVCCEIVRKLKNLLFKAKKDPNSCLILTGQKSRRVLLTVSSRIGISGVLGSSTPKATAHGENIYEQFSDCHVPTSSETTVLESEWRARVGRCLSLAALRAFEASEEVELRCLCDLLNGVKSEQLIEEHSAVIEQIIQRISLMSEAEDVYLFDPQAIENHHIWETEPLPALGI